MNFDTLMADIQTTHEWFVQQTARQINTSLTLRNWLFGMYIVEYEQNGHDKATYGKQVVESLAQQFKIRRIKLGKSQLYICRDFYSTYPHFWQFILEGMAQANAQPLQQRLSVLQTNSSIFQTVSGKWDTDRSEPSKLLNQKP